MELDYEILEEIRMYYAGELSPTDFSQLEGRMDKDEKYAYHERLFRTASRGVSTSEKEWMKELDRAEQSEDNNIVPLRKLKKNDRRRTAIRRWSIAASVLLLIASFGLLFWPTNVDQPIAEQPPSQEELVKLGATGTDAGMFRSVEVWEYDADAKIFRIGRQRQPVVVYAAGTSRPLYEWPGDTVSLYTAEPEVLETAGLRWLIREADGTKQYFLSIGEKIYAVKPGTVTPTPLQETKNFTDMN